MRGTRHGEVVRYRRPSAMVWVGSVVATGMAGAALMTPAYGWLVWIGWAAIDVPAVIDLLAAVRVDDSGIRIGRGCCRRSARFDWDQVLRVTVPEPADIWSKPLLILADGRRVRLPPLQCRSSGRNRVYAERAVQEVNTRANLIRARRD